LFLEFAKPIANFMPKNAQTRTELLLPGTQMTQIELIYTD